MPLAKSTAQLEALAATRPRPSDALVGRTLATDIVHRLRQYIVAGIFKPNERLKFDRMREIFDASFSTLREALGKLAVEGLVVAQGQRGFVVAPASAADLRDLTNARLLIGMHVLADSIVHGDESWETRILATYQRMGRVESRFSGRQRSVDPEWSRVHAEFHDALTSACRSPILLDINRSLFVRADRYRSLSARYSRDALDKVDEHRPLMEACLKRDVSTATVLLDRHFRQTEENVLTFVPEFRASADAPAAAKSSIPATVTAKTRSTTSHTRRRRFKKTRLQS